MWSTDGSDHRTPPDLVSHYTKLQMSSPRWDKIRASQVIRLYSLIKVNVCTWFRCNRSNGDFSMNMTSQCLHYSWSANMAKTKGKTWRLSHSNAHMDCTKLVRKIGFHSHWKLFICLKKSTTPHSEGSAASLLYDEPARCRPSIF